MYFGKIWKINYDNINDTINLGWNLFQRQSL